MNILHNQHKHLLVANRVAFMIIGVLEAAWAPLVPYVKRAFAIDEGTLGLLMLCSGFGSICALPLSGFLVNHFGAKKVGLCIGIADGFRIVSHKSAYKYMADKRDAYGFRRLHHHH